MANFDKSKFTAGESAFYEGKFVARFKRGNRASFINFLVKNFTVEEYFEMYDVQNIPPLKILETKGYLNPNAKKILKMLGRPLTFESYEKYIQERVEAFCAK